MKQKKSLGTIMKREWPLHVMLLPAIILLLIFAYLPMVGIVIAFQDFVPSGGMKGFFTSEWVGLDNFKYIFGMKDFRQVLVNTLVIALLKIIAGIVVPLILALMLNEVNNKVFKKATQTIIYGIVKIISGALTVSGLDQRLLDMGNTNLGGLFPVLAIFWIIVSVVIFLVLKFTIFGRNLYVITSGVLIIFAVTMDMLKARKKG